MHIMHASIRGYTNVLTYVRTYVHAQVHIRTYIYYMYTDIRILEGPGYSGMGRGGGGGALTQIIRLILNTETIHSTL